jgi:predicted RNA-binding protein with PIN domain
MPLLYFIDGYNVIHRSKSIRPLLKTDFEVARDTFVEKVARFCAATGERATIVFDGRGRRAEPVPVPYKAPGLDLVYSAGHQTADAYIERSVYQSEDRRHIVVVSGDVGIRDLCGHLGALTMSPDNFLATVREATASTRSALEQSRLVHKSLRVEDRLSERNLRHLHDLKRRLGE